MITNNIRQKIEDIYVDVRDNVGDKGSCVLGYKMYVNGDPLMVQPFQGSVSCDIFYDKVKAMLIKEGIDKHNINIDYGRLD